MPSTLTIDAPTRTLDDVLAARAERIKAIQKQLAATAARAQRRRDREREIAGRQRLERIEKYHRTGVVCEQTGEYFRSPTVAAEAYGYQHGDVIRRSICRPGVKAAGMFWRYATIEEYKAGRCLQPPSRTPPLEYCGVIRCECGTWYQSLDTASDATGLSETYIGELSNGYVPSRDYYRNTSRWRKATPAEWLANNSPGTYRRETYREPERRRRLRLRRLRGRRSCSSVSMAA